MTWVRLLRAALALAFVALCVLSATVGAGMLTADQTHDDQRARAAALRFLNRYMDRDGRVVRRDQGGDTVSEGQAYGMLLAAAIGDEGRFQRAWVWTATHLQRRDGLLASLWRDGAVRDRQPAADADLDAARALLLAGERFHRNDYRRAALRIGAGILRNEVLDVRGRPVLVAGPWARRAVATINPSYFSPRAFEQLGAASGDPRWMALRTASEEMTDALTRSPPGLPPDWATLRSSGVLAAAPPPGQRDVAPRYGYEATRLPVRMAEDCGAPTYDPAAAVSPPGWRLSARAWPALQLARQSGLVAQYDLSGKPLGADQHPIAFVAAAAAAARAGAGARARDAMLDEAEALDRRMPTYYGAAWIALGRLMLTTDLLGGCPT